MAAVLNARCWRWRAASPGEALPWIWSWCGRQGAYVENIPANIRVIDLGTKRTVNSVAAWPGIFGASGPRCF